MNSRILVCYWIMHAKDISEAEISTHTQTVIAIKRKEENFAIQAIGTERTDNEIKKKLHLIYQKDR